MNKASDPATDATPPAPALPEVLPTPEGAPGKRLPFVTVALGASAGGIEALSRFFGAMPVDSGCAFVVVMHLAPDRQSMLPDLLQRCTSMPVAQVQGDTALEANRIYVGPPGHGLELHQGMLQLLPLSPRQARPVVVDRLMISLANDQRERSVGVVLSGADGDGTLGVKAIKAAGGLTIAQSRTSAGHAGMPASAVAGGGVDLELGVEDMPAAITHFVHDSGLATEPRPEGDTQTLHAILGVVSAQSGVDFSGYKPAMLLRRVRRRMGLARIADMGAYLEQLRHDTEEAAGLLSDFLISVTEFFREADAWTELETQVIPELLAGKQLGESVRVWVPACATGEEAYSLAMVFLEQPLLAERRLRLQVFATDVDREALEVGRRGWYPCAIDHLVRPDRLQRFFVASEGGWQVSKELREVLMFAPQNLVSDPPFSRVDLVSCRNLLIYMEAPLQRRALQLLHFALVKDGILVLGKSETVSPQGALFTSVSQRARIFRRLGLGQGARLGVPLTASWQVQDAVRTPAIASRDTDYARIIREALLEHRVAAALLTNRQGIALYFHGPVQAYIDLPEGAPTTDLFAMLREELRPQLRAAMQEAARERRRVETSAELRGAEGRQERQDLRMVVSPVQSAGEDLLLVSFEPQGPQRPAPAQERVPVEGEAATLRAMEEELQDAKRELRLMIEELEAANEELKVANEEAMSMNEELQSANEELETSKEELQSINEELATVNAQLEEKLAELEAANDDLSNLLSSTHIPTLFLDRQLRIKRFTPAATQLFGLIPGDINRPLADIAGRVDMAQVLGDARQVLERLSPIERELGTGAGAFWLLRTLPYRTSDHRIEGAVLTFTDISEIKRAAMGLQRLAAVLKSSNDAIVVHDLDGRIQSWNRAAQELYGYTEGEVLGSDVVALLPEDGREAYRQQLARLRAGERMQAAEAVRRRRDGSLLHVSTTLSLVSGDDGTPAAVALIERDITPDRRAREVLRESEQRFRVLADSAPVLIWMTDADGTVEFANREFSRFTGLPASQIAGRAWTALLHPEDQAVMPGLLRNRLPAREAGDGGPEARLEATVRLLSAQGAYRWMKLTLMRRADGDAGEGGLLGAMDDIEAQVQVESEMREANRHKDEFLAMLGHELRNPLVPIRNAAEILRHVQGGDARIGWVRDVLVRQVDHVTRLVDDLLDISMVTRGTLRLRREPVDLGHVLRLAVDATAQARSRKHHRLEVLQPEQPVWVEADTVRLAQVFENLLTNATKYTDDGGHIEVRLRAEGDRAVVSVKDNGLGIAREMQARVFELFVQDQRSVDRSQGGLGIGLSLVRHLVQLHGGEVEAHSEGLGKGSEFLVRLPLLAQPPKDAAPAVKAAAASAGGRVLVVDDDPEAGHSTALLLQVMGYEVKFAQDLDSALQAAAAFRPRVVLLDVAMPEADGYEVARRLRVQPGADPATAYVAVSGYGQPEDFRRTAEQGFARHLVKPVDPGELDRLLRSLMDGG